MYKKVTIEGFCKPFVKNGSKGRSYRKCIFTYDGSNFTRKLWIDKVRERRKKKREVMSGFKFVHNFDEKKFISLTFDFNEINSTTAEELNMLYGNGLGDKIKDMVDNFFEKNINDELEWYENPKITREG